MRKFQEGDIVGLKNPSKGYENHIGVVTKYVKWINPETFEVTEQPFIEWITPSIIFVWDSYNEKSLRLVERPQLRLDFGDEETQAATKEN